MGYKIALLLKEHYRKCLPEWEALMDSDTKLEFMPYQTLEELIQIYLRERSRFDGFYVSGIIPYRALCTLGPGKGTEVVDYTNIDMANTYRILLQKFVESKVEISRIGLDFMSAEESLEEIIKEDKLYDAIRSYEEDWMEKDSIEEIEEEENRVNRMYAEHCKRNDFDLVITYFYSALESVSKYGVECFYVYPSTEAFCQTIRNIKKSISLNAMKGKMNGAIYIEMGKDFSDQEEEYTERKKRIHREAEAFNRLYLNKMILKDNDTDIELFADYDLMQEITGGFKYCPLSERLKRNAGFSGNIGYGIGDSIYQARINAMDASRYGRNMNQAGESSFLIDENENIVMLKTNEFQSAVKISESYINTVANRAKLSSETILKIVKVMQAKNSNQITSQDLMETLQISLRTANKFLSVLERNGYACVSGQKRNGNKGRPINVYKLDIHY